jgi:hypothetical protein
LTSFPLSLPLIEILNEKDGMAVSKARPAQPEPPNQDPPRDENQAFAFEKYLKSASGRTFAKKRL